jgi:hypothetical protein
VLHKQRTILVYGRPGTDRNAFPLLVAGLRAWVAGDPASAQWRLVSAGEAHDDLDLGRGVRVQSLGKLPLEAYADLLATSAVGVALMISPHPSYPPLEMAAFGCRVVTNRFANKDLSALSAQIQSVERLDPAGIAAGIARACSAAERDCLRAALPPRLGAFLAAGDPFAFANELANMLQ